eukprot:CAMPEP_0113624620 /NCGR_PEP_ID=MMETSP0017_2-20120614/12699_1 /TAXON_ID=2856 /ORGANISM="Cylindrotheca closterium" /LENGTH=388 /DNA_ID=CAMNT_0000534671 /DNA_START=73 /DNA_END=1236 /DNA_ORIENTATION=- /assembly_acc=CAM_ASM_000147
MKLSVSILFATLGRFTAAFVPFTSASRNSFLTSPFALQRQRYQQINRFARGGSTERRPQSESVFSLEASPIKSDFRLIAAGSSSRDFGGLDVSDAKGFRVIFVLGGPGAGKGTQSDLMLAEYPCTHLSVGQLLRDETSKEDSPHASLIHECLVGGKIVPVEISLALVRKAMEEAKGNSTIFLIDGFPRNLDNLEGWTNCMHEVADVLGVLVYQCPLSVLEKRILQRAKDSGRSDDNLESLRKRFRTFEEDTMPIIDTLRQLQDDTSMKVWDISGDQALDAVWKDTRKAINEVVINDVLDANIRLIKAIEGKDTETFHRLSAKEMFEDQSVAQVMDAHEEGIDLAGAIVKGSSFEFITGTKVSVSYTVESDSISFKETRIWSYNASSGW